MDLENSTTKPLVSDQVFTGKWIDLIGRRLKSIELHCYSDTDGTLEVEHSSDKTNIYSYFKVPIESNTRIHRTIEPTRKYARIKYTNSDSNQSEFILNCYPVDSREETNLGYLNNLFNGSVSAFQFSSKFDSLNHRKITILLQSDVDCELKLYVSQDGLNWANSGITYSLDTNNNKKHLETFDCCFRYYMLQTQNSASLNCSFTTKL